MIFSDPKARGSKGASGQDASLSRVSQEHSREINRLLRLLLQPGPSLDNDAFDSDWAEFEDKPQAPKRQPPKSESESKTHSPKATAAATSDWEWNEWGDSEKKDTPDPLQQLSPSPAPAEPTGPPPTNIPPPSIILSIFPRASQPASSSLLKPMSSSSRPSHNNASSPTAQQSPSSAATFTLATVAARVIAGRKQRWHRDKFLMQSMSISAASGGARRGHEARGVDKRAGGGEDREAGEVVAAWKQQVGRLRSAVVAANAADKGGAPRRSGAGAERHAFGACRPGDADGTQRV